MCIEAIEYIRHYLFYFNLFFTAFFSLPVSSLSLNALLHKFAHSYFSDTESSETQANKQAIYHYGVNFELLIDRFPCFLVVEFLT